MDDNAYKIEKKPAAKSGYYTPDESRKHYGRYSREGIAIHWWGDGAGANKHDIIVNYILGKAKRGAGSANYVVSDRKITQLVHPNNVAWCTFEANPYTIAIEIQPTLGAEGYKKLGWLVALLRQRYNRKIWLKGHKALTPNRPTACPGTLNIARIEAEAQKWAKGGYKPPKPKPPAPKPPAGAKLEWRKLASPKGLITAKQPTMVWNFNQTSWAGFGEPVKVLPKGDQFTAVAVVVNHTINASYYVTQYSYDKKLTHGVNVADLTKPVLPPVPTPPTSLPDTVPSLPPVVPTPPNQNQDDAPLPPPQEPTPPEHWKPTYLGNFWQRVRDAILKVIGKKKG